MRRAFSGLLQYDVGGFVETRLFVIFLLGLGNSAAGVAVRGFPACCSTTFCSLCVPEPNMDGNDSSEILPE